MTTSKQLRELRELRELAEKATPGKWDLSVHTNPAGSFDAKRDDWTISVGGTRIVAMEDGFRNASDVRFIAAASPATILALLDENEALQSGCEKLISALRRISYHASRHECRQTPASDLQRAFVDLMTQADDALYCFYNDGLPKQRFCEYAGCCEPAVEEALCHAHLEDWREQQAIDAAMEGVQP